MRLLRLTAAPVAAVAGLLLAVPVTAGAQMRYDRGQTVAPVFEGWERNPDGTYTMVFGYMNRNYEEMPDVPVGPDNRFEPGPADRGQPTRFYPRRQQFVFRVQVPADWGEQDLIWNLTVQGKTEQAFGSLWPSWEIDDGVVKANRGMGIQGAPADNQRPEIAVRGGAELRVAVGEPLTITVDVSDDGIPGPRPAPANDEQRAARERRRQLAHPMNQAVVNAFDAGETGLAVTWIHYRGPGEVTFDPRVISIEGGRGGEATTTVRFSEPGTHLLRVHGDDSINATPFDVTVTVR
ncbi:MAG: hypothetical protein F4Y45_18355 [Acidobacteria bacterium]|nr:hypothetical protein [Acidobacteriota bacterium]MYJ03035.1 hypothetical protein [Acidobacteriota bacterium]